MKSVAGGGSRARVPVHAQARASGVRKRDKMIAGTVVRGSGRSCRLPRLMALSLSRRPPGNRTRDDDSRSAILKRQTGSYSRCRLVPQ